MGRRFPEPEPEPDTGSGPPGASAPGLRQAPDGGATVAVNVRSAFTLRPASPLAQCRGFVAVATVLPLALAAAFGGAPRLGYSWDWFMALGAVGMGVLAMLPALTARSWSRIAADVVAARFAQRLHRHLSYALVVLIVAHVVGVLLIEPVAIEYLKPSAPWPMLSGLASAVLIVVLIGGSLGRGPERVGYQRWRRWHALGSVLAIVFAAHHLIGAGYYFPRDPKALGVVVLAILPTGWSLVYPRLRRCALPTPPDRARAELAGAERASAYAVAAMLAGWTLLAAVYAAR